MNTTSTEKQADTREPLDSRSLIGEASGNAIPEGSSTKEAGESPRACRQTALIPAASRYRYIAGIFDWLVPAVIAAGVITGNTIADHSPWVFPTSVIAVIAIAAYVVWNSVIVQGSTGRTIGKRAVRIRTVQAGGPHSPGYKGAVGRAIAHVLDTVTFVGWLRPLWNARRQTFADSISGTIVISDIDTDGRACRAARVINCGILGAVVLSLAICVGASYLLQYRPATEVESARDGATQAAAEGTQAVLSYEPQTVEDDISTATNRLTGEFLEYYSTFAQQVVIPTSKQKNVAMRTQIAGTAIESISSSTAVVLVYVNQTATSQDSPNPATTQSAIRVELQHDSDDRWLISKFDPVI